MRISATSNLTEQNVRDAVAFAYRHGCDIHLDELSVSPHGAITFYCHSVNGRYSVGRNDSQGLRAANWNSYGWVIAYLFRESPSAHIGQYRGVSHFVEVVTQAHDSYLLRESIGMTNRPGCHGESVDFLSLLYED